MEGDNGIQMFPRQTKRTEMGFGGLEELIVRAGSCVSLCGVGGYRLIDAGW